MAPLFRLTTAVIEVFLRLSRSSRPQGIHLKIEQVAQHYEKYPYPSYPLFFRGGWRQLAPLDVSQWGASRPVEKVLVAGCGTLSAFLFARRNPKVRVLGIDLSSKSLRRTRWRAWIHGVHNLELRQMDLQSIQERFDVIDAFGVLHHLPHPKEGLLQLYACLNPGGVMRIMLYNEEVRRAFEELRSEIAQKEFSHLKEVRAFLKARGVALEGELSTPSGLADALLHPLVHCFERGEVEALVESLELAKILDFNSKGNFVLKIQKLK